MEMKYGLIGSEGRMGKEIQQVMNEKGHRCVFKADINHLVELDEPEVLIDFSLPQAFDSTLDFITRFNCPLIIGTTGLSEEQFEKLHKISEMKPVVQSYNFSIGIQLLIKCCEMLSSKLPDWDIEIEETHHRFKKDKPSGTALMIKDSLGKPINISSLRIGNVVGEHTVWFGGLGETIKVSHQAVSRRTFAEGVLMAAEFVLQKEKGFYSFKDII